MVPVPSQSPSPARVHVGPLRASWNVGREPAGLGERRPLLPRSEPLGTGESAGLLERTKLPEEVGNGPGAEPVAPPDPARPLVGLVRVGRKNVGGKLAGLDE